MKNKLIVTAMLAATIFNASGAYAASFALPKPIPRSVPGAPSVQQSIQQCYENVKLAYQQEIQQINMQNLTPAQRKTSLDNLKKWYDQQILNCQNQRGIYYTPPAFAAKK